MKLACSQHLRYEQALLRSLTVESRQNFGLVCTKYLLTL
jgi:hypothetical protein